MSDRTQQPPPTDRSEPDHASRAADHLLALVAARDPKFRPTAELHDALALLLDETIAAGGAR